MHRVRLFALIGVFGALWALVFSAISTTDYAAHLDRGLHDLHCSFIPGAEGGAGSDGCRVALNSPYAAVFKESIWGGVPISLFGLGCFAFLVGHAVCVAASGERTSRNAGILYFLLASSPLLVSLTMFAISWFQLGSICKTCAGIYIGSAVLAISAIGVLRASWGNRVQSSPAGAVVAFGTLAGIAVWTLAPSVVYAALAPDHEPYVGECGKLEKPKESHNALLQLGSGKYRATSFEDPLCPTCKSLHDRLSHAGVLERLSLDLALFPLDNECNWMLDQPLHPGACRVSRAVLCAKSPQEMLDWVYENQAELVEAGAQGNDRLDRLLQAKWGKSLTNCMDAKSTTQRLNHHLHFAVDNSIAVSTPQIFIEGQRLCDEDIDIGLMFALKRIAPGVVP